MSDAPDNMRVWRQVDRTDPRHTKAVTFGRKFTSIDAHYQVMRATETFGPVGEGWMYACTYGHDTDGTMPFVWCDMTIHWGASAVSPGGLGERVFENHFGPVRCTAPLKDHKGAFDKDAPKKAMTDAITKALSHLGFNADVFLGKFDDNAYVTQMRAEFDKVKPDEVVKYEEAVQAAASMDELRNINMEYQATMAKLKTTHAVAVGAAAALWTRRKVELQEAT
jgi:hypothetical protein